jgi:hypothetical protein
MSKHVVTCMVAASLSLSSCANMDSKQRTAAYGAGTGAAIGGLVGGLLGGGEWAAIGAASGALLGGLAGYALAPDPFTQSTAQTANEWQTAMSAKPEATKVTPVVLNNGQKANQIDEMRIPVRSDKMVTGGRLSHSGETLIRRTVASARSNGGGVQILYPANAPKSVLQKLLDTGASVQRNTTGNKDFVLVISKQPRNRNV